MIHNIEMEYINADSILENHFKTLPQYIYTLFVIDILYTRINIHI